VTVTVTADTRHDTLCCDRRGMAPDWDTPAAAGGVTPAHLARALREPGAGDAEQEASPSSSSPGDTASDAAADRPPRANSHPLPWVVTCLIILVVKAAQCVVEGEGSATLFVLLLLPYALHITLVSSTRLSALLPRALRGVDACAAQRIYTAAVYLAALACALATGINPVPGAAEQFKSGGDIGLLLATAVFARPRSPALGVALSLLAELPAASLLRWHALACCGQLTCAGQALVEVGLRSACCIAVHAAMWFWDRSTLPPEARAGRAAKLKVV
jgi:hypothetical protein